jgi:hypothetical protein
MGSANNLLKQVDHTINIFEGITRGWAHPAQGLFLFDNAPSHQKCAEDALSARGMIKGVCSLFSSAAACSILSASRKSWTLHKGGARMRDGKLPTGEPQVLYFPDDHPM